MIGGKVVWLRSLLEVVLVGWFSQKKDYCIM